MVRVVLNTAHMYSNPLKHQKLSYENSGGEVIRHGKLGNPRTRSSVEWETEIQNGRCSVATLDSQSVWIVWKLEDDFPEVAGLEIQLGMVSWEAWFY